jgi:epoxyqueuosine reductase
MLGNWIFGCDACQECCPQVERIAPARSADFLEYDPDFAVPDLIELMRIDKQEFRRRFAGTPIIRSKRRGLLRNVAVALGNSGNAKAIPALRAALEDEEPLIRGHAAWALERIAELESDSCRTR